MGTTKLTRKEILAEDPIHQAMTGVMKTFREQGKLIGLAAAGIALVAAGIYFGVSYYQDREMSAQGTLARGMDFFHATIDLEAPADPYGKGPLPVFRNEPAKYEAASKEFSSVISLHGSSKVGVLARYYLGLCQLRMGREEEAVKTLEVVRGNTKDRTVGYLAKKILAQHYMDRGNSKGAQEILEGMIKDPQCDLPREVLQVDLANTYVALGKNEDAVKLLREARDQGPVGMFQSMVIEKLSEIEANTKVSGGDLSSAEEDPATEKTNPER